MCTKSRDKAWTRLWRALTRYSNFTVGNSKQRSIFRVGLTSVGGAYECSYPRCQTKCSTRAALHVQGHTRPVIEPGCHYLCYNSPTFIILCDFAGRICTKEIKIVGVTFVIGTNLTGHPTNWKRPCTTSESFGSILWIIHQTPIVCRYGELRWIKLSRILHIW